MPGTVPLLVVDKVSKSFPGVQALDGVSFAITRGEVMALVGENGAGKSTLMKILSGALTRDSGTIRVGDRELPMRFNPAEAQKLGIGIIYQELSLLTNMTIAENIYLAKEPLSSRAFRTVDFGAMNEGARARLAQLKSDHIPVTRKVGRLSLPEKQIVEIAKALAVDCRVIIMDEPTTPLTADETHKLFDVINALKQQDVTVIYITHRLEEVFQIADRVTVFRDGRLVDTVPTRGTSAEQLISMMTGREWTQPEYAPPATETRAELLRVVDLSDKKMVQNASFELYENEVVGIAGLIGSGRTELARMVFGASPKASGEIHVGGREVAIHSPRHALKHGIGYLSENRKEEGLNLGLSISDNILLADLASVSSGGVIRSQQYRNRAMSFIRQLNIRGRPGTLAVALSGGNQQKVVISKWLHVGCRVLIFDEPTRGVDVAAKAEVHGLIRSFASDGRGAVVISSEVEELLEVSDRIYIMVRGRIVRVLRRQDANKDIVLRYASGG